MTTPTNPLDATIARLFSPPGQVMPPALLAQAALAGPFPPTPPPPRLDAVDTEELNRLIIDMVTGKPRVVPTDPMLAKVIKAIWAEADAHPDRIYEITPP